MKLSLVTFCLLEVQAIYVQMVYCACGINTELTKYNGDIRYGRSSDLDDCTWSIPRREKSNEILLVKLERLNMNHALSDDDMCSGILNILGIPIDCEFESPKCWLFVHSSTPCLVDDVLQKNAVAGNNCNETRLVGMNSYSSDIVFRSLKNTFRKSFKIVYRTLQCSLEEIKSKETEPMKSKCETGDIGTKDIIMMVIIVLLGFLCICLILFICRLNRKKSSVQKGPIVTMERSTINHNEQSRNVIEEPNFIIQPDLQSDVSQENADLENPYAVIGQSYDEVTELEADDSPYTQMNDDNTQVNNIETFGEIKTEHKAEAEATYVNIPDPQMPPAKCPDVYAVIRKSK